MMLPLLTRVFLQCIIGHLGTLKLKNVPGTATIHFKKAGVHIAGVISAVAFDNAAT